MASDKAHTPTLTLSEKKALIDCASYHYGMPSTRKPATMRRLEMVRLVRRELGTLGLRWFLTDAGRAEVSAIAKTEA